MWLLGCFGLLPIVAADTWWTSAAWSYTYLKTPGSHDDVVCDQCVIEFDGNLVVGGSQGIDGISYERDSFNGFLCKVSEPISAPSTWMYSDMTRFDWDLEPKSRTSWKKSHMTGLGKTQSHIILVGYTYGLLRRCYHGVHICWHPRLGTPGRHQLQRLLWCRISESQL